MNAVIAEKRATKLFLDLAQVPVLTDSDEFLEELRATRNTPMENETSLLWAIQEGEDADTRQVLPTWVSKHVEKFVFCWSDEQYRWNETIRKRHQSVRKPLTATQKKQLEDFEKYGFERKFLFHKGDQKLVTKLKKKQDMKDVSKTMFSLKITIDPQTFEFSIQAGNGVAMRLLLLQGEPVKDVKLPLIIDGVAEEVHDDALEGELEQQNGDAEAEQLDQLEHIDGLECEQLFEEEEQCVEQPEFAGDSSDEEMIMELAPPEGYKRVKNFNHREAYKHLESKDLTAIPTQIPGVTLSFHKLTRSWQGYFPGSTQQMSFSFAGTTKRAFSCHHIYIYTYIYTYIHIRIVMQCYA